jgi:hypothetical protein
MADSREEIFEAWAPAESRWSAWAKPVLFAHAPLNAEGGAEGELPDVGVLSHLRDTALILDLPGPLSVHMGLALAETGFQPVPLYNSGASTGELVDMRPIASLLTGGAVRLKRIKRRPNAPPAFLLNSDRLNNSNSTMPGRYDNRWCLVPQDMPSAEFLLAAGIKRVVVVGARLQDDLAHVLYRYQEANLPISHAAKQGDAPRPVQVAKPSSYKSLWYRLGVFAGLRRNSAGGFGAMTPDASTGGSGGFS